MLNMKRTTAMIFLMMVSAALVAGTKLPLNDSEKEWLTTVDAIITYGERKTFKKELQSHEERQAYIDLFWRKRDPDLSTEINEFKDAYLARHAHITQHPHAFDDGRVNSYTMEDLYLVLGEPDRRMLGTDPRLMSIHAGRRLNRISGKSAEVWEYKKPGLGFKRHSLKVQFIPTSTFGDYVALADSYTERFLNDMRKNLIVNPNLQMETTPQS